MESPREPALRAPGGRAPGLRAAPPALTGNVGRQQSRSVILGVRGCDCRGSGAHEMPGCLPRCWLPGQTENSLSWVRMWTLLGIGDFSQTFQK